MQLSAQCSALGTTADKYTVRVKGKLLVEWLGEDLPELRDRMRAFRSGKQW